MAVTLSRRGGAAVAAVDGEIDHHTARAVRETIDDYITLARPELLILDLSAVGFMDSSGIGLIMGRWKLMNELGGSLEITGASPAISRMITLAGLSRLGIVMSGERSISIEKES